MGFCPGCGKKLHEGQRYCKDCRPSKDIKVKDINVKICTDCGKYFYKNKWKKATIREAVKEIARKNIKTKVDRINPLLPKITPKPGYTEDFEIEVIKENDVFIIPGQIEFTYCNRCSIKQGEYFEGKLQLRNPDNKIMNFVEKYISESGMHISKKEETRNGFDITLSDKKRIQTLGNKLKDKFGGILKISPHLFSQDRQTSKVLYRVNVLYECPKFKKGDVVKIDDKVIRLSDISKNVSGLDLKTGKKVSVPINDKEVKLLEIKKTRVSKIQPQVEILNPETYQSMPVQNQKKLKNGEKVKVVNDNGLFYIV